MLIVIAVLAGLMGVAAFALVFGGASDYAQTARVAAAERAEQLARSAVDEALGRIEAALGATGTPPPWKDRLTDELDRAIESSHGSARPEDYRAIDFELDLTGELAATRALSASSRGASLAKARMRLHDFRPMAYPAADGFRDPAAYYREKVFGDLERDPVPRDFTGQLTLDVSVDASVAGQSGSRRLTVTHDVKVLDVTPPAREFTLFNYGPPPDERYAYEDLNRGGVLAAFPKGSGRVFVRGPLFLEVEDASDPASFGGPLRESSSVAYPEVGKRDWHGWATIPSSRAVRMPNLILSPGELLNTIGRLLSGSGFAAFTHPPQRPVHENPLLGNLKIPIVNMSLPGVFLLGLCPTIAAPALGGYVGLYQAIPPEEELAIALNWAYLTGSVPRGRQTFSITGLPPERMGASAADPTVQMFRGVLVTAEGKPKARPYEGGLDLPRSGYGDGLGTVEEMDAILPEPFYASNEGDGPLDLAKHDHGMYGVYKIATYDRYIYAVIDLGPLLAAIPVLNVWTAPMVAGLRAAGMMIAVVPIHYKINGPGELTSKSVADLEPKEWEQYFFAPFGLHFDSGQNQNFLGELASDIAMAVLTAGLTKLTDKLVAGKLFGKDSSPAAIAASEKAGDRLSSKVSGFFTGVGRDSAKVHGLLRWTARRVGEKALAGAGREAIQAVLVRRLLESTVKGAIAGGAFAGVAYAMTKVRRALLGNRLTGRNIGAALAEPEVKNVARSFPKGFYPPKYRPWFRAATRVYETFEEYLRDHPGELDVTGIVLIRKLDYDGGDRVFTYRGRGVIAALGDEGDEPRLRIRLRRADAASHLTLAYENLAGASGGEPSSSQLALGSDFEGTVYASEGIKPAGSLTRIKGNLVTYHLNKGRIDPSAAVRVYQDTRVLPPSRDRHSRKDWWAVAVSPRLAARF